MSDTKKTNLLDEKKPEYQEIQERLAAAIKAVLDQQMATNDPPEVLETFERLQEEGFSSDEARGLIGHVVSLEVAELLAGTGVLNVDRYIESLGKLPEPFTTPKEGGEDEEMDSNP